MVSLPSKLEDPAVALLEIDPLEDVGLDGLTMGLLGRDLIFQGLVGALPAAALRDSTSLKRHCGTRYLLQRQPLH